MGTSSGAAVVRSGPNASVPKSGRHVVVKKQRLNKKGSVVKRVWTVQQKTKLESAEPWLGRFRRFLEKVPHGRLNQTASEENITNVFRRVHDLVSGRGVSYHKWDNNIFYEGQPITLETDLNELLEDAKNFLVVYGTDNGNGWMLTHPIQKLILFKEYENAKKKA